MFSVCKRKGCRQTGTDVPIIVLFDGPIKNMLQFVSLSRLRHESWRTRLSPLADWRPRVSLNSDANKQCCQNE